MFSNAGTSEDHNWKNTVEDLILLENLERAQKHKPATWSLVRALPLICPVSLGSFLNLPVPSFSL